MPPYPGVPRSDPYPASRSESAAERRQFPLPERITLALTHRCNLACGMCTQYGPGYKEHATPELPVETWMELISSLAWIQPELNLFGGEPLLYPGFAELLRHANGTRCRTTLVTNGSGVARHLPQLQSAGTHVVLSIDGLSETHARIRGSNASAATVYELLPRLATLESPAKWSTNTVLLPDNVREVPELVQSIAAHSPSRVVLQHPQYLSPQLRAMSDGVWSRAFGKPFTQRLRMKHAYNFDDPYVAELVRLREKLQPEVDRNIVQFIPDLRGSEIGAYYSEDAHFGLKPEYACVKPWLSPTIAPNGDVLLCLDGVVGNIAEEPFWSIWNGAPAQRFREVLSDVGRFPMCTRCCTLYGGGTA